MLPSNWIYASEEDEVTEIISEVKRLPIVDVLSSYGVVPEKISGHNALALCPFHMDNTIGSFVINTVTNTCHCFSCGEGGGTIRSVAKILDTDFIKAALQIACDQKLINEAKFKKLAEVDFEPKARKIEYNKPLDVEETKSIKELKEEIYLAMAGFFGLNAIDKEYLLKVRQLKEESLSNYFSIDTVSDDYLKRLAATYPAEKLVEIGKQVPGFYLNRNEAGVLRLDVLKKQGIGILMRNAKNEVIGVQVRSYKDENPRYTFLSYKVPKTFEEFMLGGASIKTPFNVIYSSSKKLAIVEGIFKAEILAQNGFNVISVQGVNNFSGIETQIKAMERKLGFGFNQITVFYDADFVSNPNVCAAAIKLGEYLYAKKENIEVKYAYWDEVLGKGIDDLIFAGKRDIVKLMAFEDYKNNANDSFTRSLFNTGFENASPSKLTKDDRNLILREFKAIMRKKMKL